MLANELIRGCPASRRRASELRYVNDTRPKKIPRIPFAPHQRIRQAPFVKRAIYAGSFDPITNGHLDVLARAAKVFEQVNTLPDAQGGIQLRELAPRQGDRAPRWRCLRVCARVRGARPPRKIFALKTARWFAIRRRLNSVSRK